MLDGTALPAAVPMYSKSSCQTKQVTTMYSQTVRNRKWKTQVGGLQTGCAYISASGIYIQHASNGYVCFRGPLSNGTSSNDIKLNREKRP